jgi:hypothetical protein
VLDRHYRLKPIRRIGDEYGRRQQRDDSIGRPRQSRRAGAGTMRWRRGLLRLWGAVSVLWVATTAATKSINNSDQVIEIVAANFLVPRPMTFIT